MYEKDDQLYNPTISALLSYSAHRRGNEESEFRWIVRYFERHWGQRLISHFLDPSSKGQVEAFVAEWRARYPLISAIYLIDPRDPPEDSPPSSLVLALEVDISGYFKLIHDERTLKGSLLRKGANTVSIPTSGLFEKSGTHVFLLEFMVDSLIVKKPIEIEIQMENPPPLPRAEPAREELEYTVSLYIGDRLVVSSRRALSESKKLHYEPRLFKPVIPYEPPKESTKELPRGFDIIGALGMAAKVISGLVKKKEEPPAPPVRKVRMMTLRFNSQDGSGDDRVTAVTVMLKLGEIELRRF